MFFGGELCPLTERRYRCTGSDHDTGINGNDRYSQVKEGWLVHMRPSNAMPHKPSTRERVLTLIDQGWSATEIGKILGGCLDRTTINNWVKEHRENGQ